MRIAASFLTASLLLALTAVSANAQQTAPSGISVTQHGDGQYFADPAGMALYVFDRDDTPGKSRCNDLCAKAWPPVAAAQDAKPVGEWAPLKRDDGSLQWGFKGKPVYTFAKEGAAGTTFGDSIRGPWHAAMAPIPTPPEAVLGRTLIGTVLTNQAGFTLYRRDGKHACDEKCALTWAPLVAPMAAVAHADWRPVMNDNGIRQWSYKGDLLFSYSGDVRPGDTYGDGLGKEWHAAILQPPEPQPSWVTYTETDAGEILTNAQHLAIYTYVPFFGGPSPAGGNAKAADGYCDAACRGANYHPLPAADTDKPVGNWTIVDNKDDGIRQWAFKGRPIYTNSQDKVPGDFVGVHFGDVSWKGLMRSGLPMQGAAPG
jgi:predicted lipoprotein with Yx(FWY)xxD motif